LLPMFPVYSITYVPGLYRPSVEARKRVGPGASPGISGEPISRADHHLPPESSGCNRGQGNPRDREGGFLSPPAAGTE